MQRPKHEVDPPNGMAEVGGISYLRSPSVALLCGTLLLLAAALDATAVIPSNAHPNISIRPDELWPLRGYLLINMAWLACLGSLLFAVVALLLRARRLWGAGLLCALTQIALAGPSFMGSQEFLRAHRWWLVGAFSVASVAGFYLAFRIATAMVSKGRLHRRVVLAVLAILAAGAAAGFWYVRRYANYPGAMVLVFLWAQLSISALVVDGISRLAAPIARLSTFILSGVAIVVGALGMLDPFGFTDGVWAARLDALVAWHAPGTSKLVHLNRSARAEWYKLSDGFRGSTNSAPTLRVAELADDTIPKRRLHVVLFVIDALRRDSAGSFGARPTLMPNLDALAASAIRFERAYSPAPGTGGSIPAMLSGLPPTALLELSRRPLFLPELLGHHGYATSTSITAQRSQIFVYPLLGDVSMDALGFQQVHEPPAGTAWEFDTRQVDQLLDRLRQAETARFEYVHMMTAHGPFLGSAGRANYGRAMSLVDHQLGRLVAGLRQLGLWSSTLIIVTSDHGEAIGEHGMFAHAQALYEEQVAVPLIMRIPGAPAGIVTEPLSLTRLPSLVMEALGSHWPLPTPERTQSDEPEPVTIQEHFVGGRLIWRSIRNADRVYHHRYLAEREELYDLLRDPGELQNLAPSRPDEVTRFRAIEDEFEAWVEQTVREIEAL